MTEYIARPTRPVTTEADDQTQSKTAPLPGGGYVVAWIAWVEQAGVLKGQVVAQTFDANGAATSPRLALFGDPIASGQSFALGGVDGLAGGGFAVSASTLLQVAGDAPQAQVLAQSVTAQGEVAAPQVVVSQVPYADGSYPSAGDVHALADGGYFVEVDRFYRPTPLAGYQTELHRFASDGAAVGVPVPVVADEETYPRLSIQPDGDVFGVGFRLNQGMGGSAIAWSLKSADGIEIAGGTLKGTSMSSERSPQVAALANGTFMVVWNHEPSTVPDAPADPWPAGMVAQLFDGAGQPLGGVFAFGTAVPSPHILALADGGVLAWGPQGGTYVAQTLDALGQPTGDVFDLGPGLSHIAATADGGFLVSVQQVGTDSGPDVYLREFDPVLSGVPVQGTPGNDVLAGTPGDDTIDGGAGVDAVRYEGARGGYSISIAPDGTLTVTGEGTDTLSNVERLHFADVNIAFDTAGHAGQAYRLYQAAFERAPDLGGLGFHIGNLDAGVDLATVAAHFLASPEFQSLYGPLDDTSFVTALYDNVLQRAPDDGGLAYHLASLGQGASRAQMLVHFSESPENQAAVIGDIQWGMAYSV